MENEQQKCTTVSFDALQKMGNGTGVMIAKRPENICTRKLSIEEQQQLHNKLTGFELIDVSGDGHWVLHDEDGYEFYGNYKNVADFSTLSGFFEYCKYKERESAIMDWQRDMKKLLGL